MSIVSQERLGYAAVTNHSKNLHDTRQMFPSCLHGVSFMSRFGSAPCRLHLQTQTDRAATNWLTASHPVTVKREHVLVESGAPVPSQIHNYSCNENYEYSLHMINKGSKKIHVSSGQVLPPNEFAANFPKTFSFQDVLESGIVYKGLWTCTIMDPPYE
ncbi:hypothetical protein mRhiFer1_008295 [Rhinolophus ferrumequinum]|uniref:Uncharacterized protein n=1 Tax=Rhinolophus ferrumequinum TaxID=59479 RepID=A0A7J7VR02_RHIFE|nr:hypothetical protein mRhiFer1_008295 [Rhinolophus ferrumequinum]